MCENHDLVRSIFAAWGRGDFGSTEWADPEIEFVRPDGPEPGRWIGLAGMAEGTRAVLDAWQEVRVEAARERRAAAIRRRRGLHRAHVSPASMLGLPAARSAPKAARATSAPPTRRATLGCSSSSATASAAASTGIRLETIAESATV